jgi:hypothetical protein
MSASLSLDVSSSPIPNISLPSTRHVGSEHNPNMTHEVEYELTKGTRHSIAQAITTFRSSYAILHDASGQIDDYAVTTCRSPRSFPHILRPFSALNLDRPLLEIISTITIYTADLEIWYETCISPVDVLELQKRASLLMYRLFDWYQCSENHNYPGRALEQSICLALLTFMVEVTEPNVAAVGSRLSKTARKLRETLQDVHMTQWTNAPELLFWTLTMGALGAKRQPKAPSTPNFEPDSAFFKRYSKAAFTGRNKSGTCTAEHLLDKMRTCLWITSIFAERAKKLWVAMGLCRTNVVEPDDASSSEGEQGVEDEYALGQSTTLRFFTGDENGSRRSSVL